MNCRSGVRVQLYSERSLLYRISFKVDLLEDKNVETSFTSLKKALEVLCC